MIDRCEERFGDTGNAVISATEWLAYVNAAYRAFLRTAKWPNLQAEVTATIAANGHSVAIPAAALQGGILDVFLTGGAEGARPLEPQPADLPQRNIRHWRARPTSPLYFQQRGGRISVLPAWLAGGTLTLSYLTAPTALAVGTSPVIPETYHDALISGALAQAYRDDGNPELASAYQAEFDAAAQAAMPDNEAGTQG